jgi:hypothetical protein
MKAINETGKRAAGRQSILATAWLSKAEKDTKTRVYKQANNDNVHIEDRGDMVLLKARAKSGGLLAETPLLMSATWEEVKVQFQKVAGQQAPKGGPSTLPPPPRQGRYQPLP